MAIKRPNAKQIKTPALTVQKKDTEQKNVSIKIEPLNAYILNDYSLLDMQVVPSKHPES